MRRTATTTSPKARGHGVADEDIVHAIDHALAFEDAGESPDRWLLIGPDTAGNLLQDEDIEKLAPSELIREALRRYLDAA